MSLTKTHIAFLMFVAAVLVGLSIYGAVTPWLKPIDLRTQCNDTKGQLLIADQNDFRTPSKEFRECLENSAKIFLEKDYAETKDLAKTFFTLISAILVASITFSEKIVDIHNTRWPPLVFMIGCWVLLLVSMTLNGIGLVSMTLAAGQAAYFPYHNYRNLEEHAVIVFIGGGFAFGFALLALIIAGVLSLLNKRATANA